MESLNERAVKRLSMIGRHFPSLKENKKPIKVAITGAAGQIGYVLTFMVAQGRMFGPYQPLILHLIELPAAEKPLSGLVMEINDGAFPLVTKIVTTTDIEVGFTDIDVALLVGARPRGPGMERKDLLSANSAIFKAQGQALDKKAKKTVKVVAVGNPANTNALIASTFAPSIPKKNFTALTRLDQNRAVTQIASRVDVSVNDVKNLIIWGNHSATQYPDVHHAYIVNFPVEGITTPVLSCVNDDAWVRNEFITKVQKRGAEIIAARKLSSAASAANAVCDHIHDWLVGTEEIVSMGVSSDNNPYGVAEGLVYSFPVTCKNGEWKIVPGLPINEFSREKMNKTQNELKEEKEMALGN